MRIVKVMWNQRIDADANYSFSTEIVLDEDRDPVDAGRDALKFLQSFQDGFTAAAVGGSEETG